MTTQHDPDTIRAWASVALSWTGTGAAWALDNAGPIAALVSVAYTLWQWRRQVVKDRAERRARELLQLRQLSDEYNTRPGIRR